MLITALRGREKGNRGQNSVRQDNDRLYEYY